MESTHIDLTQEIRNLLNKHSGGLKFMELIPELVRFCVEKKIDIPNPDDILLMISSMDGINCVRYHWDMGGGNLRVKYFICTV